MHRHPAAGDAYVRYRYLLAGAAREYREQYLQPQLGLFETATTLGHIVQEGSPAREEYRNMIFYGNAFDHWQNAIKEPQNPRPAPEPMVTPNAHRGHSH